MVSTFWDIPGILSDKTSDLLERLISPVCIYSDRGQPIYFSPSFLTLFPNHPEKAKFFDYFATELTTRSTLETLWEQAIQGETAAFFSTLGQGLEEIECCLQFNADAKVMLLLAQRPDLTHKDHQTDKDHQLIPEYEQRIALLSHPNLTAALIDLDGTIVKCDQRLHKLLGTNNQETLSIDTFVHPGDKLVDADLKQKLIAGELNSYTIEKRLISRNGEIVWISASVSLINVLTSTNQHRKYLVILLEDITENRRIYSALIRTEEKWKTFILNSSYLFIQTNSFGQIIYTSPAIERTLGYQEAELVGRNITEIIHPKNLNGFELVFQLWLSGTKSDESGMECWWKTKSSGWVCFFIQGQRFPSVLEMDGIVISGYEITKQKRLEVELKSSHEKFNSLLINNPGAIFRCDSSYTMKFVSNSIKDITGYPASTFVNNQARSYISIVHPEDIILIKDSLVQSTLDHYSSSMEYRIIHANGHIRWVLERKQGVFDQYGNLQWLDGVLLDISDHHQSEASRSNVTQTKAFETPNYLDGDQL